MKTDQPPTSAKATGSERTVGALACAWGITGVLLLLGTAIVRLSVPAREAFEQPLGAGQWVFLTVSVVVMSYAEGVRGFQRSWSPRVAARALRLRHRWTPRQALLAPLFCMGFFDASRRRIITAWSLTLGIIVLVLLVSQLSQPWRGLLDVGVIVGLIWGVTSVMLIFGAALSGRRDAIDPGVPGTAPASPTDIPENDRNANAADGGQTDGERAGRARSLLAFAAASVLATSLLDHPANAQSYPLRIEHRFGTAVIETRPQRVATLDFTGADNLLALGVQPVLVRGLSAGPAVAPWAEPLLEGEPAVVRATLDYETIAAARPDVIIALWSGITRADHDKLAAIAPVVAVPEGVGDYGLAWDEIVLRTGLAIGRESQAEDAVGALRDRIGRIATEHPDWQDRTATIAFRQPGSFGTYSPTDVRPRLLAELGLRMPDELASIADEDRAFIDLSEERIGLIDADVILWGAYGEMAGVRDWPLRVALDAASEGREIFIDQPLWFAMGFASLLSLPITLDRLMPKIEAAIDGDPETVVPEG